MKKSTYLSLLGLGLVLCLGSFQNCSKVAATDVISTMSLAAVSDTGSIVATDQTAVLIGSEPDQENSPTPQLVVQPDSQPEIQPNMVTVVSPEAAAPEAVLLQPGDEAAAVAECLKKPSTKAQLDGTSYSNLRGSNEVVADEISNLENNNGNLIVRPRSLRGKVAYMNGNGGNQLICNMDIDLIENSNGNLTLVNCRVKDLRHHKGVIKSFSSSIERTDGKVRILIAGQKE